MDTSHSAPLIFYPVLTTQFLAPSFKDSYQGITAYNNKDSNFRTDFNAMGLTLNSLDQHQDQRPLQAAKVFIVMELAGSVFSQYYSLLEASETGESLCN